MISFNEDNTITIKFNKKFYAIDVIKESLKDFVDICNGKISTKKDFFVVNLKQKGKKVTGILGYEFCNYVLGLMKNKTLV